MTRGNVHRIFIYLIFKCNQNLIDDKKELWLKIAHYSIKFIQLL